MEKILVRGHFLTVFMVCFVSFISVAIAAIGFLLGDFQAVLYAVIAEMCGLFMTDVFTDAMRQQREGFPKA